MGQRRKPELWFTPSFRCYSFECCCHGWRFFSLHRRPNPPFEWSPCLRRTVQLPLTASPCSRLSRPQSTISQSDFHPVIRPFSPLRLGRSYRLAPEPDGSPLFTLLPLVACWRYRTPGAPQTARVVAACDSAFPFERQGQLLRSRSISGLFSRSLHSGLQPPCLRFAAAVTGHHARLGSRLLARLCRGRHRRRQTSTRLQGATRTDPRGPNSGNSAQLKATAGGHSIESYGTTLKLRN